MSASEKTTADVTAWKKWLEEYTARLKIESGGTSDLDALQQQRVQLMNDNNPRYLGSIIINRATTSLQFCSLTSLFLPHAG